MLISDSTKYTTEHNFFKHGKVVTDTVTADKDYKHGDFYPANDETATGIVYHDTKKDMPLARITEAHVFADRLTEYPTKEAYDRLRQIVFFDGQDLYIPADDTTPPTQG